MRRTRRFSIAARAAAAALALLLLGQSGTSTIKRDFGELMFGPEIKDFRMGIALQKRPTIAGHPIDISYSFENTRKPPEVYRSFHDLANVYPREPGKLFTISMVDARGEEVPKTLSTLRVAPPRPGVGTNHGSSVGPGQTRSVGGLPLHRYYDLSMPGQYRFRVTRFRFSRAGEGGGDLASGEIVFDVVEPPPEAP